VAFLPGGHGSLGRLGLGHALLEFIHTAGRIDELLLARVKRMAGIADTHNNHRLGGPGPDHIAARATNLGIHVLRMYVVFHKRLKKIPPVRRLTSRKFSGLPSWVRFWHKIGLIFDMKKDSTKTTKTTEAQLLDLLKRVLPKATHDAQLAGKIYEAIENELKVKARTSAFDKFCARVDLPDLEPKTVEEVKRHLTSSFGGGDITLKPDRKEKTLAVEVAMPDGAQFSGEIKVNANAGAVVNEEQEITLKFIPFPVCLPGDKELVWMLAKRENLSSEEAGIALTKIEEDFWASKTGQKLLRDRVERIFPEFISRVPSGMLNELGLKRHYKTPEPLKILRNGPKGA
jgi:hypothetical protein